MSTHTSSEGYEFRPATMDDLPAVLALITACDMEEFGKPDYSLEELREEWEDLDLATDAWIALSPRGDIVGSMAVGHRAHVRIDADGYVHPKSRGRGIGTALAALSERRARQHVPLAPHGARVVLSNYTNGANEAAGRLLEGRGYALARRHWRMLIEMGASPPAPAWPEGIAVRPFEPGRDERATYDAVTEAFGDMWGYIPPTFEQWRETMIDRQGFDPTLWLLAYDGEEVAGFALCEYRLETGWVRSLGVRRPWRRRGLGTSLLRRAFGEFCARGTTTVGLGVDSESPTGATRLYERAGMRVERTFHQYQKVMSDADSRPSPSK